MQLCATESIAVATLSVVEIASTLSRRLHAGQLTPSDYQRAGQAFLAHGPSYMPIALTNSVLARAAEIVELLPRSTMIRSLDAIHLACAEAAFLQGRIDGLTIATFVTADHRLLAAA
jgi:predicted nucleic acid-binding protein